MGGDLRKLMVLGAGTHQVAGIRAAAARGLHVVTVDYSPDNIGHRYSHEYVNASTTDRDAVLAAARRVEIDAIVTFASDPATPTVAYVAQELGLPGSRLSAVEVLSNKSRLRGLQHERGFAAPRFSELRDTSEIVSAIKEMSAPVIFKPVDSSGSRGVNRVDQFEMTVLRRGFQEALQFSRSGVVCVEEFIPGVEVGGDGFLSGGKLLFAACTHKRKRGYVVTGHSMPCDVSRASQELVLRQVEDVCAAAGYDDGPINFDVIVKEDRAVIVEMSARTGGNGIPALIFVATGFDPVQATIDFALGHQLEHRGSDDRSVAGTFVFGSGIAGTLTAIASERELRERVPGLVEYACNYSAGDHVPAFEHGGAAMGYCVFSYPESTSYDQAVRKFLATLQMEVSPA